MSRFRTAWAPVEHAARDVSVATVTAWTANQPRRLWSGDPHRLPSPYGDGVDGGADEKRMRLRHAGTCRVSGVELAARAGAIYERTSKTVPCVSHDRSAPVAPAAMEVVNLVAPERVESGTAGASARRELERRKAKGDSRIRAKHPKLGALMIAVTDQPQSTTAWDIGARRPPNHPTVPSFEVRGCNRDLCGVSMLDPTGRVVVEA